MLVHEYFDLAHQVQADEIDGQGHVHNLQYLAWTLKAASKHSAAIGWDSKKMQQLFSCGWVVRSHEIQYRLAALHNDQLIIRTWISQVAKQFAVRRALVCRMQDKRVLAKVSTRWVMADLNQRRAIAIPEDIIARMTVLPSPPPAPWSSSDDN